MSSAHQLGQEYTLAEALGRIHSRSITARLDNTLV